MCHLVLRIIEDVAKRHRAHPATGDGGRWSKWCAKATEAFPTLPTAVDARGTRWEAAAERQGQDGWTRELYLR